MTSLLIFLFFGLMVVLPVLYLIFTNNVIRAAFALVVALLGVAAMYVLLHAEFMAVVQILIYAGGIIVLLIFGIMLTNRSEKEGVYTGHRRVVVGVGVVAIFLGLLIKMIYTSMDSLELAQEQTVVEIGRIGVLFLTDHLIAFELVAFVLLVALVGAAFLAKKSNNI